jgi:Zn-dependent protease/predicted transcriptional regulator
MPTELPERENNPLPPEDRERRDDAPRSGPEEPSPRRPASEPRDDGSIRIATVAGIPIRLHWTFLALLVWLTFLSLGQGKTNLKSMLGVLFVVALFGCVLLHELGHALVAQRYGVRTRKIVLYPIGGVASLESLPRPRQELWIALSGPAVNLVIAALLYVGLRAAGQPIGSFNIGGAQPNFAANLLWANLWLAAFNLLPAFPMDGGRVLRALIARVTDEASATAIAARIGQGLAILLGLYGLFGPGGNFLLVFIAVFVYLGAGQEASAYQTKALVTGHRVDEAMMREFHTLPVGTTLREAADTLLAGSQSDFPIVHGGEVLGVLSRSDLLRGMAQDPDGYVAGVMQREFARARPDDSLESVLAQRQASQIGPILVMDGDALHGMLTQENLLEFLMLTQIRNAQTQRQAHI